MRTDQGERDMTDNEKMLERFEGWLDALMDQFEQTTHSASDPIWMRLNHLKKQAWNLRGRNPKMKRLYGKLNEALRLLEGQFAQRSRFLVELRGIRRSNGGK
jgi:hypothetical protein